MGSASPNRAASHSLVSASWVATDGEEVAFSGAGSGFIGLFVSDPSGLYRVIDTNDTLEGKDVTPKSSWEGIHTLLEYSVYGLFFRMEAEVFTLPQINGDLLQSRFLQTHYSLYWTNEDSCT